MGTDNEWESDPKQLSGLSTVEPLVFNGPCGFPLGNKPSAATGGSRDLTAMAYLLQGPSTTENKPPRIKHIERIERISGRGTFRFAMSQA